MAVPAAAGGGGGDGGCRAVLVRADRYVLGVVQDEGCVSSSLGQVDQLGQLLGRVSQLLGKQGGGEEECWPWSYIDQ